MSRKLIKRISFVTNNEIKFDKINKDHIKLLIFDDLVLSNKNI